MGLECSLTGMTGLYGIWAYKMKEKYKQSSLLITSTTLVQII